MPKLKKKKITPKTKIKPKSKSKNKIPKKKKNKVVSVPPKTESKLEIKTGKVKRPKFVRVDMSSMTPLDGRTQLPFTIRKIHG